MQLTEQRVKRHHYSLKTIQLSIQQRIISGISLRGIEKNWKIGGDQENPSYSSIRKWLGRVALYELTREKEFREDWLLITDLTMELGKEKCLVILGVSQKYYQQEVVKNQRGLKQEEVEVLGIEIMASTRGELIAEKLTKVTEKVGKPKQIVSDHGSDLYKGIKLYQQKNPEVIHTYDVTHQMALLLKKALEKDENYQEFTKLVAKCRPEIQQTELSYLRPPSQRKKSRDFNLDKLIDWGENVILYEEKQDFSLVDRSYLIDEKTLQELSLTLKSEEVANLRELLGQKYRDEEEIQLDLLKNLSPMSDAESREMIIKIASKGRRRFLEKLGWLKEYKQSLSKWSQMLKMTRTVETQLKQFGLNQESISNFEQVFPVNSISPELVDLHQKIKSYLTQETALINDDGSFLATSDIIESIFGKYKFFSSKSPLMELGQMILTIPLVTINFTVDFLQKALETISFLELNTWQEELFGQSSLSKRRIAFSAGDI